jgi:putative membrane protein
MHVATTASLICFALIYALGARTANAGRREIASFAAGWTILMIALASPLEKWTHTSLTAHMAQHELLMVVAAPLLASGGLELGFVALAPRRRRRALIWRLRMLRIDMPVSWALHSAAIWAWYVPALYQAAMTRPSLHTIEHISLLGTAVLFWRAVLDRRLGYAAAAFYVFATSLHKNVLGALLFLSPRLWYPVYGNGPAVLADQQLAGLVMWAPGGIVLAGTALFFFARWLAETERRVARERMIASRAPGRSALSHFH